ncbi:MAG TPA: ligase-associated DNA damage response DEXH box helicase, partial [Chitinophagales bacterium]|nr:ligase-associated DNA damage response DEXH box helicase [Chitinophagales bacterium]
PTGSGKTYAVFIGAALDFLRHRHMYNANKSFGLQVIWITPIRALAKEIAYAAGRFCLENDIPWRTGVRTGDTTASERTKQRKNLPEVLVTTPESLHLLLASKGYDQIFKTLKLIVFDEWHELMGTKRAVQCELALSRLRTVGAPQVWGISATIGNLEEAMDVLLTPREAKHGVLVRSNIRKEVEVIPVIPPKIERYPWAGHLGINLLHEVIPVIRENKSTLVFTNTRSQAEIWYRELMNAAPDLSGLVAMHHGSMSRELRDWVEDALHDGKLKAVVCTSSLDLGVDFRPVDTVVQVGGPKGVARFAQRAGRSGHRPGAASRIFFVPTHSLELVECAALRQSIAEENLESRLPFIRSFDVLVQYLVTLAVSDGFFPSMIFEEVKSTFAYNSITTEEWQWVLSFIVTGGASLAAYEDYKKVEIMPDGRYAVTSRRIAMRHRLSIGTIVSDVALSVKYMKGSWLGSIEESFISRLQPGDVFWFAGRNLEYMAVKELTVLVKNSKSKKGVVPSWQGGRMPLSTQMSHMLRRKLGEAGRDQSDDAELKAIQPLLKTQRERSHVPNVNELLVEYMETREGHHLFMYPFEGRSVHEGLASLLAYRISIRIPITFTIAYNDYGFELLSDVPIPIDASDVHELLSDNGLVEDLQSSVNMAEMARRRFRDVAGIAGLTFKGFPGKYKKDKYLQASSQLFFNVFRDFEPSNLLYRQAYQEVLEYQLEEHRMRAVLTRIAGQTVVFKKPGKPTPFCFPIMVDRMREKISSESIEDRVRKMVIQIERD